MGVHTAAEGTQGQHGSTEGFLEKVTPKLNSQEEHRKEKHVKGPETCGRENNQWMYSSRLRPQGPCMPEKELGLDLEDSGESLRDIVGGEKCEQAQSGWY